MKKRSKKKSSNIKVVVVVVQAPKEPYDNTIGGPLDYGYGM